MNYCHEKSDRDQTADSTSESSLDISLADAYLQTKQGFADYSILDMIMQVRQPFPSATDSSKQGYTDVRSAI